MDKIKLVPMSLFAIGAAKLLILSGNWTDVAILLVLGSMAAFWEFKTSKKREEIVDLHFQKQDEVILKLATELNDLRSQMSTVKMSAGLRPTSVGRQSI